jgi:hypothetical protein
MHPHMICKLESGTPNNRYLSEYLPNQTSELLLHCTTKDVSDCHQFLVYSLPCLRLKGSQIVEPEGKTKLPDATLYSLQGTSFQNKTILITVLSPIMKH